MNQARIWPTPVPSLLPRIAFCLLPLFGADVCFTHAAQIHPGHAVLWSVLAFSLGLQLARALRLPAWRAVDDNTSMYAFSNVVLIAQYLFTSTPVPELGVLVGACLTGLLLAPELSRAARPRPAPAA